MFFLLSSFRYSDFNLLEIFVWLEWLLKHWRILWMKSVPLWICSFDEKSLPEPVFPSPVLQREAIRGLKPNKEVCNDLSATLYSQEYVAKRFFFYYCVTNYYKWISVRYYPFIIHTVSMSDVSGHNLSGSSAQMSVIELQSRFWLGSFLIWRLD